MDLMEAINDRRSVRKYKPDAVPEEILQSVLEAVRRAPSWANTQCWEVIVVKDPARRSQLAATLPKGNPALASMTEAPVLLVLCGIKGISGFYKGQPSTERGDWMMFDMGIAIENLCLAAHALGLGTVVIGMFDYRKAGAILGLPENVEVVAMTPLGYPAGEGSRPKRKELATFVFHETYGKDRE